MGRHDASPDVPVSRRRAAFGLVCLVLLVASSFSNGLRHGLAEDGSGWSIGIFWIVAGLASVALIGRDLLRHRSPRSDAG